MNKYYYMNCYVDAGVAFLLAEYIFDLMPLISFFCQILFSYKSGLYN